MFAFHIFQFGDTGFVGRNHLVGIQVQTGNGFQVFISVAFKAVRAVHALICIAADCDGNLGLPPSETMFRLAIPPADAWLAALTEGTVLFQLLVMAAPTAYRAPDAEAVGKLILILSVVAAGAFFGASAFLSPPPQPVNAPTINMVAKDALTMRFKGFFHISSPPKKINMLR